MYCVQYNIYIYLFLKHKIDREIEGKTAKEREIDVIGRERWKEREKREKRREKINQGKT